MYPYILEQVHTCTHTHRICLTYTVRACSTVLASSTQSRTQHITGADGRAATGVVQGELLSKQPTPGLDGAKCFLQLLRM